MVGSISVLLSQKQKLKDGGGKSKRFIMKNGWPWKLIGNNNSDFNLVSKIRKRVVCTFLSKTKLKKED